MKKKELETVVEGMKALRLPKFDDKNMRTTLFQDFMKLLGLLRKFKEDIDDLKTVFLSSFKDEQDKVGELQQKLQVEPDRARQAELLREINSHKDYFDNLKALNEKIEALGNEAVTIKLVDGKKFADEFQKQEYDLAVMEKVYPLLEFKES